MTWRTTGMSLTSDWRSARAPSGAPAATASHGAGPFGDLGRRPLALLGQGIAALAAGVVRLGRDEALVLEQLQGRVDRTRARPPQAIGTLGEFTDYLVTMHGPFGQQGQDGAADVAAPRPAPSPATTTASAAASPASARARPEGTAPARPKRALGGKPHPVGATRPTRHRARDISRPGPWAAVPASASAAPASAPVWTFFKSFVRVHFLTSVLVPAPDAGD